MKKIKLDLKKKKITKLPGSRFNFSRASWLLIRSDNSKKLPVLSNRFLFTLVKTIEYISFSLSLCENYRDTFFYLELFLHYPNI